MNNAPPRVIVSNSPAILVPIDGAPVVKPVPDSPRFSRVINTRALILQGGFQQAYYMHVYDGWMTATSLDGPWTVSFRQPFGMDDVAAKLAKSNTVDMLSGGANANPKPSLANGAPAIYTSQQPTELIVFKGQPDFVPIVGTQLLWASNTTSDVLIDTTTNNYYLLLAGRWFRSAALTGPYTFVASDALPAGFKAIPPHSLAGAVLPTVAGTPQAQEAVIANSIPQTATVPLKNGPKFTPNFDGPPQYAPVPGTPLSYVVNSSVPVIQVSPNAYYAVTAGVWFTAPAAHRPVGDRNVGAAGHLHDPAGVADLLRHLRAHLRSDAAVRVRRLYARLHGHGRVAVRHRRVRHRLCLFAVGRHRVVSAAVHVRRGRRARLQPLRRLHVRLRDGPRHRGVDGAVLGRRVLPPRLLGRLSVLRVGQRQRLRALGQHHLLRHAVVVRRRRRGGHHGQRQLLQQSHRHVRHVRRRAASTTRTRATRRAATTAPPTRRRAARPTSRAAATTTSTRANGRPGSSVSATGAGGSTYNRAGATTAGPEGNAHVGRRLDLQREDRQYQHLGHRVGRQQSLRRRERQRVQEHRRRLAAALVERLVEFVRGLVVGEQGVAGALHRRRPFGQLRRRRLGAASDRFGGGGGWGGDRSFGGGGGGGWGGRFGGAAASAAAASADSAAAGARSVAP